MYENKDHGPHHEASLQLLQSYTHEGRDPDLKPSAQQGVKLQENAQNGYGVHREIQDERAQVA